MYDMVVKIKADTMDKLKETITWNLRKIEKIKNDTDIDCHRRTRGLKVNDG